jgi:glutamine synthetase
MELPPCVEGNMFSMEPETLKERKIERIPETLGDAIEAFEENEFMKNVLGEHVYTKYLEAKKREWRDFRAQVTDWEVSQYLYRY